MTSSDYTPGTRADSIDFDIATVRERFDGVKLLISHESASLRLADEVERLRLNNATQASMILLLAAERDKSKAEAEAMRTVARHESALRQKAEVELAAAREQILQDDIHVGMLRNSANEQHDLAVHHGQRADNERERATKAEAEVERLHDDLANALAEEQQGDKNDRYAHLLNDGACTELDPMGQDWACKNCDQPVYAHAGWQPIWEAAELRRRIEEDA